LTTKTTDSPEPGQLEVSAFGPGFGEAIVLNLGTDEWLTVDSCIDVETKESIPLRYLGELGVDIATQVSLVAATHWHSDHVRGIADLFESAKSAAFACSVALRSSEFTTLVAAEESDSSLRSPGLRELSRVFATLRNRDQVPVWAIADRPLLRNVVHALSPSDSSVTRAILSFGQMAPQLGTPKQRVQSLGGNDGSVATWVNASDNRILLGGDLEEHGRPSEGWSAVLGSKTKPEGVAQIFKVSHHGSKNAHLDGVWREMLGGDSHAVVAPWSLGSGALPTNQDISRICALTSKGHLTAPPQRPGRVRHDSRVERLMKDAVKFIRSADRRAGQVRLRKRADPEADWVVEYFDGALRMCS
jgi:beta-lactamase superfamily II metal-dependent hydrolase